MLQHLLRQDLGQAHDLFICSALPGELEHRLQRFGGGATAAVVFACSAARLRIGCMSAIETAGAIRSPFGAVGLFSSFARPRFSHSEGVSQASTALLKHQASTGRSEAGRALLDPSEILRLSGDEASVFLTGVRHPIKGRKIVHFRERRYRGRWD